VRKLNGCKAIAAVRLAKLVTVLICKLYVCSREYNGCRAIAAARLAKPVTGFVLAVSVHTWPRMRHRAVEDFNGADGNTYYKCSRAGN